MGDAFRVIVGDYVTTTDGTGIVHIAPTFGADDNRVAKQAGIAPLFVIDRAGKEQPMVDRTGKFFRIEELDPAFVERYVDAGKYGEYAGRYVKNAYDERLSETDPTLDIDIAVMLKAENKAFKIEKHPSNCWLEFNTGNRFRLDFETTFTRSPNVASTSIVLKSVSTTLCNFIKVNTALSLL